MPAITAFASGTTINNGGMSISTQLNGISMNQNNQYAIPNPPSTGDLAVRFGNRMNHPWYYGASGG